MELLNGDAEGHYIPKDRLFQRFKSTFRGQKELIVLMHDTDAKYTTVESLPYIIEYLQEKGYEFHMLEYLCFYLRYKMASEKRILIVEDEEHIRKFVKINLEKDS